MKLSSLFKHKAYAFGQPSDAEQDCLFAESVLKKARPKFKIKNITLSSVCDDYDIFHIINDKDVFFKLKVSLSDPNNILKKEVTALRSLGSSENIERFFNNYFSFVNTKPVRAKYGQNLELFCEHLDPEIQLPEESIESLKGYTDYNLCRDFFLILQSEIKNYHIQLNEIFKHKCHGGLDLDSIFYNNHLGGIENNRDLYFTVSELQLRKKLGNLLLGYIKEVYLYDSYRYDKIIEIADIFSHLYERFCVIPAFKENRDFIMKTICEPIFGVKA